MTAKGGDAAGLAPILSAVATLQTNAPGKDKEAANDFLQKFQKSVSALKHVPYQILTDQFIDRGVANYSCYSDQLVHAYRG
jgi:hypothetical protein